jgi:hypothetical protein
LETIARGLTGIKDVMLDAPRLSLDSFLETPLEIGGWIWNLGWSTNNDIVFDKQFRRCVMRSIEGSRAEYSDVPSIGELRVRGVFEQREYRHTLPCAWWVSRMREHMGSLW